MKQNRMKALNDSIRSVVVVSNDRLLMKNCRTMNGVNENDDVQIYTKKGSS